uniref:NADH-ubiquinone oxidoreductase chain 2 n=1 Tax=Luidia quinaria TaxID=60585 RepID=Q5KST3_9ECHI|nr:NADH dehydrogenase subunit 2 [Luidia quinaria]BAD86670.1 NADH dehydrogenase subunit 2 [Luidia quinaria]
MHRNVLILLICNIILSTVVVISSHHWFTVWVGLEMNTLSILPLLCFQFSPRNVESTIKYFLIQSFSAGIILNLALVQAWVYSSWSVNQEVSPLLSSFFVMALGLKLGLFPCHHWFPDVIQGAGFLQGLLLSTWQKVAPLIVLSYLAGNENSEVLTLMGGASVLVGGWGGLNQTQTRKILAFSSIAHIGWVYSVMSFSLEAGYVMFLVYVIINSGVFLLGNKHYLSSLASFGRLLSYSPLSGVGVMLGVLSLGGLPPLFGFLIKFLALNCLIQNSAYFISAVLVAGSLISLFFYLRIVFNSALVFFPQHSVSIITFRSAINSSKNGASYFTALSFLISLNCFGLACCPLFVSFLNN